MKQLVQFTFLWSGPVVVLLVTYDWMLNHYLITRLFKKNPYSIHVGEWTSVNQLLHISVYIIIIHASLQWWQNVFLLTAGYYLRVDCESFLVILSFVLIKGSIRLYMWLFYYKVQYIISVCHSSYFSKHGIVFQVVSWLYIGSFGVFRLVSVVFQVVAEGFWGVSGGYCNVLGGCWGVLGCFGWCLRCPGVFRGVAGVLWGVSGFCGGVLGCFGWLLGCSRWLLRCSVVFCVVAGVFQVVAEVF